MLPFLILSVYCGCYGDSETGMMEMCAQTDSISGRQFPWVNGGVILLGPLLCSTPPLSGSERPSLSVFSWKGKRLMASGAQNAARAGLSIRTTGSVC